MEAYRLMVAYSSSESLSLPEVSDEDGHPVLTFTNSLGQVLLIRTFSGDDADPMDTYYVYDGHGMLCWVLPPLAADTLATDGTYSWNSNEIDRYAYYYRYDGRQQLIVKKLPGAERIETIYDLAGRVALIEDGNLRAQRRMQYFYYDVFGNVREMGLCSLLPHQTLDYYRNYISRNRFAVQGPTASSYMEERKGLNVIEKVTPLQYYWYDTYDFLSSPGFSGNPNFTASTENAKGKLTGSQATVFGSSDVIRTVYHYDRKGRLSKTTSNNLVGGYDIETLTYTFTNQIKTKERVHTSSRLSSAQTELYTYTYDDWGKLLTTTHKLNNNPAVTLASYTYDALGRNSKKTVNNGSYASTYSYNIRSWLEKIEGAKFTQQLYYHTGSGTPCYNGNVSSMTWKADGESVLRGYKFSYDGLNRLTSSVYGEGSSIASNLNRYTENMTYDKMGNILSIKRYGKLSATSFGLIDDLSLSYTGNQLQKVTDRVTQTVPEEVMHFTDNINSNIEYTYDSNGNLLSDLNKNISKIEYNVLNLPEKITFSNGDWTGYVYDSGGNKLRVTHHIGQTTSVTDYAGSMIYENGILSKTLTENGYVSFSGTTPAYHYYLTDHLGNNRLVMNAAGAIKETNHYYPFGSSIIENGHTDIQMQKYGNKELDKNNDLNWYDFEARFYDPSIQRFTSMDANAENYYSVSPYSYCFNNPLKYIDPSGNIVEDPDSIYINHKNIINSRLGDLNKALEDPNLQGGLRNVVTMLRDSYVEILNEYSTLENSDVVYRISFGTDGESRIFMDEKFSLNINVASNNLDLVGHELKHAYQFETNEISISNSGGYGSLYDLTDEVDAYNRESLLNNGMLFFQDKAKQWDKAKVLGLKNDKGKPLYQKIPTERRDINSPAGRKLRNMTQIRGKFGLLINDIYRDFYDDYKH